MARVSITRSVAPSPNPTDGAVLTYEAADTVNKNQTPLTGKELIIARNVDATNPYTVTINSVADPYGRTLDITADSLAAGVAHIYGPFGMTGWRQADGMLYFEGNNLKIEFAVVTLP